MSRISGGIGKQRARYIFNITTCPERTMGKLLYTFGEVPHAHIHILPRTEDSSTMNAGYPVVPKNISISKKSYKNSLVTVLVQLFQFHYNFSVFIISGNPISWLYLTLYNHRAISSTISSLITLFNGRAP